MSVEQTSQLIQLVLNSVLMVAACGGLLMGLLARYTAIYLRLRTVTHEYLALMADGDVFRRDRITQLKLQQQQLRHRYRAAQNSILVGYAALLLLLGSTLTLALRTLLNWQWLISFSLQLFVLGVAVLLLGVVLALIDFYTSRNSLLDELKGLLALQGFNPIAIALPPATLRSSLRKPHRKSLPNKEQSQVS